MPLTEIRSDLQALEKETALLDETNFSGRADAIDFIEFHILDRIEGLLPEAREVTALQLLQAQAQELKRELEDVDARLFAQLRNEIKGSANKPLTFRQILHTYGGADLAATQEPGTIGYDNLDIFINGLLSCGPIPDATLPREKEMVFYQKTPARIVLEMVEKAQPKPGDVFFDLGSGLGQVALLVHLLSGIKCVGVEYEPAYCTYANAAASQLGLSQVHFLNLDARAADYSQGSLFFLYTPFEGQMLQEVLTQLQKEAEQRAIRVFTYGPCSRIVAQEAWLCEVEGEIDDYKLGVFESSFLKPQLS